MKQEKHNENPGESGNVIWFILVAIILLAALTFAIGRSSDTAQQSGNTELMSIQASDILRYSKGIEQAIDQMQTREISVNNISFASADGLTGYANPNCTTENCMVFKTAGGAQTYEAPKTEWLDSAQSAGDFYGQWIFTGSLCIQGVGNISESVGTSCAGDTDSSDEDLVMVLPYITYGLCKQLNTMVGVNNPGGNPPVTVGDIWVPSPQFVGAFSDGTNIGANNADLYRKPSGCVEGAGTPPTGTYTFYHVLVPR